MKKRVLAAVVVSIFETAIFAACSVNADALIVLAAGISIGWYLCVAPAWGSGWRGARLLCTGAFVLAIPVCALLGRNSGASWNSPGSIGLMALAATCLYFDLAWALSLRLPPGALEIRSPFVTGAFAVVQGGSVAQFNHHHRSQQQRYALDIVMSGGDISGAELRAPCVGKVVAAMDGMPDVPDLGAAGPAVFGNHVAIETESGAMVVLAHLASGSVAVRVGDQLTEGAPIGRAGNSGRSSEPHLHIHAECQFNAVPLLIDGKWLVRNGIITDLR